MRQRRWLQLLSDYDCENRYHPRKANMMADALSRKESIKPLRVRALVMTIGLNLPKQILNAQTEVRKEENFVNEDLQETIWTVGSTRNPPMEMGEHNNGFCHQAAKDGHRSRNDLSNRRSSDQVCSFPAHEGRRFVGKVDETSLHKALGTQLDMSIAYHLQTDGQSERTIQTLEDMLRACVLDFGKSWDRHLPLVEFSYNNSYHTSIKAAPFEAFVWVKGNLYPGKIYYTKKALKYNG
ncbi:putative reverse transcriptase domain-containing protein, partial [Tanacetum coccineum]